MPKYHIASVVPFRFFILDFHHNGSPLPAYRKKGIDFSKRNLRYRGMGCPNIYQSALALLQIGVRDDYF